MKWEKNVKLFWFFDKTDVSNRYEASDVTYGEMCRDYIHKRIVD